MRARPRLLVRDAPDGGAHPIANGHAVRRRDAIDDAHEHGVEFDDADDDAVADRDADSHALRRVDVRVSRVRVRRLPRRRLL